MTELSLIFGLVVGALLFTAGVLRWLLSLESGGAEARRLSAAVQRAAGVMSWRQAKRGAAVTASLVLLVLSLGPLQGEAVSGRAGWLILGLLIGGVVSLFLSQAFLMLVTRGAARAASTMHGPIGQTVILGLRTATVVALLSEVAALILASAALVPLAAEPGDSSASRLLLGGLAVGALIPALLTHLSGGAVYFAGQLGRRDPLFRSPRYSYQLDTKNPTMVLDAVGVHLGQSVVRGQTGFCGSLLVHVASLIGVLELSSSSGAALHSAIGLPLVIRAVGLASCVFAVMATRVDDAEDALDSLYRGQVAASVLSLAGVWGSCYWFLGEASFLPLAVTGSISSVGAIVVSYATRFGLGRSSNALRNIQEAAKLEATVGLAATLGSAFTRSLGPLGGMLLALLGLYLTDPASASVGLSLAVVLASFASAGAYSAALSSFEPLVDSAGGLLSIDERHRRPDLQSKVSGLRRAAQGVGGIGQAHALTATTLGALGIAWLLWPQALPQSTPQSMFLAVLGAFVGTALVLGYCGAVIGHLARTAKVLKSELVRQLRGFSLDAEGYLELPNDFRPRYKDHLEEVGNGAIGHSAQIIALTFLTPISIGVALAFHGGDAAARPVGALVLMTFVAFATLTGLCLSLLSSSAAATWGCAVRETRLDAPGPTRARAVVEAGMCLAEVTTPMAQLIVASAAASSVALLAMLF